MSDWRPVALRKSPRFGLDLVLEESGDQWNWFVFDDDASRIVARGKSATIDEAKLDSDSAAEMHELRRGMAK